MQIDLSFQRMLKKKNKITDLGIKKKRSMFSYHNAEMVTIMNKPFNVINEFFIRCHFLLALIIIFSLLCSPTCQ